MDAGLEKVVAAETVLSDVQGAEGRLIIRGKDVETLAREFNYEQTAEHLWADRHPALATATLAALTLVTPPDPSRFSTPPASVPPLVRRQVPIVNSCITSRA